LYGAFKLAAEVLLSSYCYTYGINSYIFRLANVVGSRSSHGIIIDFIEKLKINDKKLEILGEGL
jgi:UDP-glucose 4-epimerase